MRGRKTKVSRERITCGYVRVSSREQLDGHSLGAQESRLRSLAESQGVELGRVFVDAGYSAGTLKRPAVRELLAAIQRGEISALYVCKLDRLCRSLADLLAIVRLCEKHDVALVSASEAIDTGSPAGKMMLAMLGAFAEFERARISERIADVAFDLRSRRQAYCRHAPFGYRRSGTALVPVDAEQAALAVIRRMHNEGASYRQIATWLTENGIQPKGRAWYASSVRDVLRSRMNAA
jgi:site-specific DNA recombinase